MADDIYIDADGRRRLGQVLEKATPAARPTARDLTKGAILGAIDAMAGGYVSPLDPPPGHIDAAHRPECGREGRGCVCHEPEKERAKVLRFPRGGLDG